MTTQVEVEFDRSITDKAEGLRINVARTALGREWVHLNIRPHNNLWPCLTAIVSVQAAAELAQALLEAVGALKTAPAGWETVDTDTD